MPKSVEGDGFGYSRLFEPVLQWIVNHASLQAFEHLARSGRPA